MKKIIDSKKYNEELSCKLDDIDINIKKILNLLIVKPIKKRNIVSKVVSDKYKKYKVNPDIFKLFEDGLQNMLNNKKIVLLKDLSEYFNTLGNSTIHRYYKIFCDMHSDIESMYINKIGSKVIFKTENKQYLIDNIDVLCEKKDSIADEIEKKAKQLCIEQTSFTLSDISPQVISFCGMGKLRKVLHQIEWLGVSSDSSDSKMFVYYDITEEKRKREELKKICADATKNNIIDKKIKDDIKSKKKEHDYYPEFPDEIWSFIKSFSYYDVNDKLQFILKFAVYHTKGFNRIRWNNGMMHKLISQQDFIDFCNDVLESEKEIKKLLNKKGKFVLSNETFLFENDKKS